MMVARAFPFVLLLALSPGTQGRTTTLPTLPSGWQSRLATMLPQPGEVAAIKQSRPSISTVQLRVRVQAAGGDPDALQEVIITAARNMLPEYNERLGISRDEFRSYLVFQNVLVPTGKNVKLAVVRDASRLLFGDAPGLNGVLKGLTIDLKTGELRGPEGFSARITSVPANSKGALDIRGGFQWKMMGNDSKAGNSVKATLNLLQLPGGEVVLQYNRTSIIRRAVIGPQELILSYNR